MTIRYALAVLIGITLLFAALGTGIGAGLGRFNPGYYRIVFRGAREPSFDPVAVGVGQGLTQGTAGGGVVGVALIALFCWRETRLQPVPSPATASARPGRTATARILLVSVCLLAVGVCVSCGFVGGGLIGEQRAYIRECERQNRAIAPVLEPDPAFKDVAIDEACCDAGWVLLTGRVETKADFVRLQDRICRAIGEERGKYAVSRVQVKEGAVKPDAAPEVPK